MSGISETSKAEVAPAAAGSTSVAASAPPVSCRKKKSEMDEGFVKDMMNHIDEFVHASYDEHKSCLQKSVKKLFGMNKAVENAASASPPVISVLPLRVDTATE